MELTAEQLRQSRAMAMRRFPKGTLVTLQHLNGFRIRDFGRVVSVNGWSGAISVAVVALEQLDAYRYSDLYSGKPRHFRKHLFNPRRFRQLVGQKLNFLPSFNGGSFLGWFEMLSDNPRERLIPAERNKKGLIQVRVFLG